MIKIYELYPGITLRCFPDDRFKQNMLTLQFLRPLQKGENALNALIPAVLLRGCKGYEDLRSITLKLDDLYGAAVGAVVRKVGDWQTTGLSCSCIADRYALDGDRVLEPMLAFFFRLMLEPLTENGSFRGDFVESEKRNLIQTVEAQRNDKRGYANTRLMNHMCGRDPFGISRLGQVQDISAITAEAAYRHYQLLLRQSPMELFYVGPMEPDQVAGMLRPYLERFARTTAEKPVQSDFAGTGGGSYTESMEVTQSRLCMGFTTPATIRTPEFVAMQLLNTIFGAGMTCKLFMQIREKLSLCYDIGSAYHGVKGLLLVAAGIDSDKQALVRQQVLLQLEECQKGNITPQELEAAKQALICQLQAVHDSPGAIENYYGTAVISGMSMSRQDHIEAVQATTLEQVVAAAKTLQLHTVYFMEGVQ